MKLLGNFIAVKKIDLKEEKRPSGLFVPITAETNWIEAEVLYVGAGWTDQQGNTHPIYEIEVGDKVLVDKYALADMRVGIENLQVCGVESVRWNLSASVERDTAKWKRMFDLEIKPNEAETKQACEEMAYNGPVDGGKL